MGNYVDRTLAWAAKEAARKAKQQAARERRERQAAERRGRIRNTQQAASRPEGVQEAGNAWVGGQPAYYEDGGTTGRPNHRDRYYGPNGPFGPGHHHDGSEDGGETWEQYH